MEERLDFDAEFKVRLPSKLDERIAQTAKKERRSKNLQYVYMLEDWFEMKEGIEKRLRNLEELIAKEVKAEKGKTKKQVAG